MREVFSLSEDQLKELEVSVGAFAKKRASWLEGKTKRRDNQLWRELLQDALTDTWLGEVTWDPSKASLEVHLKGVIRSRTSKMMLHLTRFPRVDAHAPGLALEQEMSGAMEAERADERGVDLGIFIEVALGALTALVGTDDEVLLILDCFANGVFDRRDILRAASMTESTYHNARRRLTRLVERLPQNVRDQALRAMG